MFCVLSFAFCVLGVRFCALGFGFWVLGFGFCVLGFVFWVLGFVFWVLGFGRPLFESCKFDLARFAGRPCACLGGVWEVPGTPGGHWKKANTQNCERQVSLPKTASVWKVLRGLGGLWEAPLGGFAERPCPASKGFWEGPQILKGSGRGLGG